MEEERRDLYPGKNYKGLKKKISLLLKSTCNKVLVVNSFEEGVDQLVPTRKVPCTEHSSNTCMCTTRDILSNNAYYYLSYNKTRLKCVADYAKLTNVNMNKLCLTMKLKCFN